MDNELAFLTFSPSGEYFVTGFGVFSCEVVVWKTGDSLIEIASYDVEENFVGGYFISDTEIIFGRVGGYDDPVIWNFVKDSTRAPDDAQRNDFRTNPPPMAGSDSGSAGLVSPGGAYRYVNGDGLGDPVRIYETATGRCIGEIEETSFVYALSHDGRRLVAGNSAGFCGIFSTMESATTVVYKKSNDPIYQYPPYLNIVYSESLMLNSNHSYDTSFYGGAQPYLLNEPSGRFIATVYPDSYVAVWDLDNDRADAAYIIWEHSAVITAAYMTEEYLVTAGLDGRLIVFRMKDGIFLNNTTIENGIVAMNLDPAGTRAVAVGRSLRSAYVYDLNTGLLIYRIDAEPGDSIDYNAVGFAEDGSRIIVKMQSGRTVIGDLYSTLAELRTIAADTYPRA